MQTEGSRPFSQLTIQGWLAAYIADLLEVSPEEIDIRMPFESFGLASREAVMLSGDLEEWLGRRLEPTLAWQYPTIESLARFLAGQTAALEAQAKRPEEIRREESITGGSPPQPIAIVGIGCYYPGATGPQAFWDLLRSGKDAIREVPPERWDIDHYYHPDPSVPGKVNTRWGGFLEGIDQFDAQFFGISPREAARMDPQQRLLLQAAWHAVEDAGIPAERLTDSPTGVFIGISGNEYSRLQLGQTEQIDAYSGTGNALSIAANRISYFLNLNGPSLAVDTACSSSLVAVHLACNSIWRGESRMALAGGANLILSPAITINFSKAGAMAVDGRCKAFDAAADGYVRSEGVAIVVLKPLALAKADGDRIYALILGSAVNQDGRSNGLMAPSPQAQQGVIREACRRAGVSPADLEYVETHGTGTFLGDPIEAQALGSVTGEGRSPERPLWIGSVKSNIGHTEAAAGVAGLIKVALALKHDLLPASLHFENPNPHIPFEQLSLRVLSAASPWPKLSRPHLAGVSSFGFGGTNAHIVLQGAPESGEEEIQDDQAQPGAYLLPISARTPASLSSLAQIYDDLLRESAPASAPSLAELCLSASLRRSHHNHRLALAANSPQEMRAGLQAYLRQEAFPGMSTGQIKSARPHDPVFVFSGHGSQWKGMAQELVYSEPVFLETIEAVAQELQAWVSWSLLDKIRTSGEGDWLDEIDVVQPVVFAIQVGLARLWQSWGIQPGAVVGHSMGEVAAAFVAGGLDLPSAVRLIYHRSRLLKKSSGQGAMLSVRLSLPETHAVLSGKDGGLSVAVSNSPSSTVISGEPAALHSLGDELEAQGVSCRFVKVNVAAHSAQIEPLVPELVASLESLLPRATHVPFYSTVSGEMIPGTALDPSYWGTNLRQPVLFFNTVQRLIADRFPMFLEISPHPILTSSIQQTLYQTGVEGRALPSLQRNWNDRKALLSSLGALYTEGYPLRWSSLYPNLKPAASLPPYPFDTRRYWFSPGQEGRLPQKAEPGDGKLTRQQAARAEWLHELRWESQKRPNGELPRAASGECWLVFRDRQRFADSAVSMLKELGYTCLVIDAGDSYQPLLDGEMRIRPGQEEDARQALHAGIETAGGQLAGVLFFWGLDIVPNHLAHSSVEAPHVQVCVSVLNLVRQLTQAARELGNTPRLWLVTRGAQALAGEISIQSSGQALLWGLGRVIALEHPQLWGGLIDLDPAAETGADFELVSEVTDSNGEPQIAFRQGERFVVRLARYTNGNTSTAPPRFVPDRTYLITGGLGALGLQLAGWFVEHGARRLALFDRNELPDRQDWDQCEAQTTDGNMRERIAAIRGLEAAGADVFIAQVDVTDENQLREQMEALSVEGFPPVSGVVHAAGTLRDRTLLQMDAAAMVDVLRPKVTGGWLLHRLFSTDHPESQLDFFVSFSSAAAVLGSPGQGNYAAANAFLDALAHARQAQGLPGLSVDWGPWAERGLAAHPERGGRLADRGVSSIPPQDGLAIMGELLYQDVAQVCVVPADWEVLARQYSISPAAILLSDLVKGGASAMRLDQLPGGDGPQITQAEGQPSRPVAASELERYLRSQIARTLYLDPQELPPDRHFMELGLDSLMAIELIHKLERDYHIKLYPREIFEQPSIRALSKYLAAEINRREGQRLSQAPLESTASLDSVQKIAFGRTRFSTAAEEAGLAEVVKRNPSMVFLLSAPRSGSTLLRVMLDGHPSLFCPPELHLLQFDRMQMRRQALGATYLDEGLQRAYMELMGIDAAQSRALLDELTKRDRSIQEVYLQLQELAKDRILVDKSPSYGGSLKTLERAEELFDQAKYIFLFRHPYAAIESFVRNRFEKLLGAGDTDPHTLAEQVWATVNANVIDFLRTLPADRVLQVRYEDLVNSPQEMSRDLCSFLGVPFHPALLEPYQGNRMTDGVHAASLGINDPNFLNHDGIDPSLGQVWRTISLPNRLGGFARRVANELDYSLPKEGPLVPQTQESPKSQSAAMVQEAVSAADEAISPLVPIQPLGEKNPLFFMHPASGAVFAYYELARAIGKERPFYALQDPSLEGHREPHSRIQDYAEEYIVCIRQVQPDGPYLLGGWSFGGHLAVEVANQLLAAGEQVPFLVILDTEAPIAGRKLSLWRRLKHFINKTTEYTLGLPDLVPYVRDAVYILRHYRSLEANGDMAMSGGEYLHWAWIDSMRKRLLKGTEIEERFARNPHLAEIRIPNTTVRRGLYLLRRQMQIVRTFKPQVYPGKITFLRAEDQIVRAFFTDETLGWSELVRGDIEVHTMPGNHMTLFREPNVQTVAETIRACLERLESEDHV